MAQRLAARIARDGTRAVTETIPPSPTATPARRARSLKTCHLPAAPKPLHSPPRDNAAFVPETAARVEDDLNLTDGARRCARKPAEYVYQRDRETRFIGPAFSRRSETGAMLWRAFHKAVHVDSRFR
jgi:hypothetical protein